MTYGYAEYPDGVVASDPTTLTYFTDDDLPLRELDRLVAAE